MCARGAEPHRLPHHVHHITSLQYTGFMNQLPHGVIKHSRTNRRTDYLFRISLKCLIRNASGDVLVVKESGRTWWDLPGGGMDHGEDIKTAIARELKEEINLISDFTYRVIDVESPGLLQPQNLWQIRLIFMVEPQQLPVGPADDGDEIAFMPAASFAHSAIKTERLIYMYDTAVRRFLQ